jgi:hypothetical protein
MHSCSGEQTLRRYFLVPSYDSTPFKAAIHIGRPKYQIIVWVITHPNAPFGQRLEDNLRVAMEKTLRKASHMQPHLASG